MDPHGLGHFDGTPVISIGLIVTATGDGLSQTMKADPEQAKALTVGDRVAALILGDVTKVRFDSVEEGAGLKRVPIVRVIPLDLTGQFMDDVRDRIQQWHDERSGQGNLLEGKFGDDQEDAS